MRYYEIKQKNQKKYDDFINNYGFVAFDNGQFEDGKNKLNVKDNKELVRVYAGLFLLKEKVDALNGLMVKLDKELKEKLLNDKVLLKDAFIYELANHEYCITYDIDDAIDALPFTLQEIKENELLKNTLLEAEKQYLQEVE